MSVLLVYVVLCLVGLWSSHGQPYVPPRMTMERLSDKPIISFWEHHSDFLYNYNSAFMPTINDADAVTLLVRVQDQLDNPTSIYDVGPSKIAVSRSMDENHLFYSYITDDNVIIDTDIDYQSRGVEDPRVVLHGDTYYL
jgi:predicted GH43/DUF377 family glycosyl hydrolase